MHCLGAGVASGQQQLVATATNTCGSGIMIGNGNNGMSSCCGQANTGSSQSVNGSFHVGSPRSNVIGVARALGILVCEGRIQGGSTRGYREGVHCSPPFQPGPRDHVCEKDNNMVKIHFKLDTYFKSVQKLIKVNLIFKICIRKKSYFSAQFVTQFSCKGFF